MSSVTSLPLRCADHEFVRRKGRIDRSLRRGLINVADVDLPGARGDCLLQRRHPAVDNDHPVAVMPTGS